MHELYQRIENCIDWIERMHEWICGQNYIHAINSIEELMICIQNISDELMTCPLFSVDVNYYKQMLCGIVEAQQQEDYVLFADLLKLQLQPLLLQCQEILIQNITFHESLELFNRNCRTMELHEERDGYKQLSAILKDWRNIRKASVYNSVQLEVEPTSIGAPTLVAQSDTVRRYFHSNNNPYWGARRFAENVRTAEEYIIFGFGLGYHIQQLAICQPDAKITVFEPDIGVLAEAFSYRDLTWMINQSNVRIEYDPEYIGFLNKTEATKAEILLYYPAVSMIPIEGIREQFEGIKIRLENFRVYEKQFQKNMKMNFHNISQSAEVLKSDFYNKQVIIVAGGPSLDRNVELLKKCDRSRTRILATGAVLRKLLNMNIVPDYAIITDPKPYTMNQIYGLEDCGIPLLLMATAIGEISQIYKSDKYLICQEGMPEAETYAREKGYEVFKTGGSVATAALDVAIRLGAGSIVFIGLDLAFTGNQTHASGMANETMDNELDCIQVPDWDGNTVATSKSFLMYLQWIEKRIVQEDVTMEIYDATEGGARKQGMIPVKLEDVMCAGKDIVTYEDV